MGNISTASGLIFNIISSSWFLGIIVTGIVIWAFNYILDIPFTKKSGIMLYSGISLILYLILNR
jgi:hypothetical protein